MVVIETGIHLTRLAVARKEKQNITFSFSAESYVQFCSSATCVLLWSAEFRPLRCSPSLTPPVALLVLREPNNTRPGFAVIRKTKQKKVP